MAHAILISPFDNVVVSPESGHKTARADIPAGSAVVKYGFPIGIATEDIAAGEHVHSHNMRTALTGNRSYTYVPSVPTVEKTEAPTVLAYERGNDIGIRNELFVIPTVGCVADAARAIAERCGGVALTHPYGCSQLGDDHERTRQILRGLIRHPNAGGVLVLGLGCENNRIDALRDFLGDYDASRVRFLVAQDVEDEIEAGARQMEALARRAAEDRRVPVSAARLRIGLKCGGSDGLSGITANPALGRLCERVISFGGACALTEVPEMFGAEEVLLRRCVSEEVFARAVRMIEDTKTNFLRHGMPISENPSPGNRDGGITTLEEKSLGCVQKGGQAPITDAIFCGEFMQQPGLTLVDGPGNDLCAVTNLAAVGCHMVLFTTGRGTPLGGAVPTLKIATNSRLAEKKKNWIDFDAGRILDGVDIDRALLRLVLDTAEGQLTKNEERGERTIAILRDGVTL